MVAHVFYPELWPEIAAIWQTLPTRSSLLVTTPHGKGSEIRALAGNDPAIEIYESENRGRDIAPFLALLNAGRLDRFDAVLKIHTKKSSHLRQGDLRRRLLYTVLAGNPGNVRRILRQFSNSTVGIVGPVRFFRASDFYWLGNRALVETLCSRMQPKAPVRPGFFEGSMFWFRPQALAALRGLGLRQADFDAETGQLNGTLHHAIERTFTLSALADGFDTRSVLGRTLLAANRERSANQASLMWRLAQPVRALLRTKTALPIRKMLRRGAKWAASVPVLGHCVAWAKIQRSVPANAWYSTYRSGARYDLIQWHGTKRFSIIMPVYKVRPHWLEEAIASVVRQTYPYWELICVDDNSQDARLSAILQRASSDHPCVQVVILNRNQGVSRATNAALERATGDYVLFMDHDDLLEPHALARLAEAAFSEDADIIYGDEVVTAENPDKALVIQAHPVFSHTYYLAHPFFVHPVAVRAALARAIGGLDVSLEISHDIDFVMRALEVARRVTHVPDILYRWRTHTDSAGHRKRAAVMANTCALKAAHLHRIGFPEAKVSPGPSFNTFSVRYFGHPSGRILGIIPTKNQVHLLRRCIETVRATTKCLDLNLMVVDHESDDAETLAYLRDIEASGTARVLPYRGDFNFSAINNFAVNTCGAGYDYFLFLNNDIEATTSGWLDAMLDLGMRSDVGAVGATLLYPDGSVQHSGVIVGLCGLAEHAFKTVPFRSDAPGYGAGLHATREYSAVTAACMLVPARAFHAVHGFDERLAVGFNDTDLCLRIGKLGNRIVNCAEAVLIHHESATRGQSLDGHDAHPQDSDLFARRYKDLIASGDPHFSPLLSTGDATIVLNPVARLEPSIRFRTVTNFLPGPGRSDHRICAVGAV
jgi:GT2 family glycosyltransferase